jgi:predicted nucleic acid-binding protein
VIVVDSSALVDLLVDEEVDQVLLERVLGAGSLHVPHLIDSEVQNALRGLVLGRKLTADRASDGLRDLADLHLLRYPAHPLAERVWELRSRLTTYDATYVALAERLECPLVTCDRKMARGAQSIAVEVY